MKKSATITIEQKPGNEFESLEAAQRAAFPLLSTNLQTVIRDLLDRGVLVIVDGKIIPTDKDKPT